MNILAKLIFLTVLFAGQIRAQAQEPSSKPPEPSAPSAPLKVDRQVVALQSLANLIEQLNAEIGVINQERKEPGKTEPERAQYATQMDAKLQQVADLKAEFVSVASNIDLADLTAGGNDQVSLRGEFDALIQPVIQELKDATAGPREIEQLKSKIASLKEERATAVKIVAALDERLADTKNEVLLRQLKGARNEWQKTIDSITRRLEVSEYQLAEISSREISIVDSLSDLFKTFFRSRGLHLIFAILVFGVIFYAVRKSHSLVQKISPIHRKKKRSLSVRILDLIFHFLGFVLALIGSIIVLYLANDWVLLTLVIFFLVGSIWVSKQAFPKIFEQAKLMLNLGVVREGERVIFEGLPWSISKINLYTELKNPALEGGVRRLPIKDLLELRSRSCDGEIWFPCAKGDWVILSDETFGRVIQQTPELVELVKLGGSRKFFPTADFLSLNPENLSKNFRIRSVFGIDYQHQPICTTEAPKIFEKKLTEEIEKLLGAKEIKNISVQFCSAGASSLDYEVLADFTGEAASKFGVIGRAIQRICVDVCNEQGWVIPFTQITVHQADA